MYSEYGDIKHFSPRKLLSCLLFLKNVHKYFCESSFTDPLKDFCEVLLPKLKQMVKQIKIM